MFTSTDREREGNVLVEFVCHSVSPERGHHETTTWTY